MLSMKNEIEKIWDDVLVKLEQEHDVSSAAINAWIKPLHIKDVQSNKIILSLDAKYDERGIQFIKKKMYDFYISLAISDLTGKKYDIEFELEKEGEKPQETPAAAPEHDNNNLNPRYTFDTFVIGDNNRMAHAASIAVAEAPAEAYNPLFLYGGAGLGKTHLMHSIAHYIIEHNSSLNVLYVTSEDFTNEVINSIQHKKQEELRSKYRNIDVLLVDDIQFVIGKESTQQEFFHTFNALYNSKKQIILSSDKPPKELDVLEERLRSRFSWGLPVDIQPPNYETKVAILRKRAELDNIYIDDEIFDYIATHIKSNIRDLEGALNKIKVYSKLNKKPIDLELSKIALQDLIDNKTKQAITPELIMQTVAEHFNIQTSDIISKKRSHDIAYPRQICMYLCKKMTDQSLVKIGEIIGKRDHSTVIHGIEKIEKDHVTKDYLKVAYAAGSNLYVPATSLEVLQKYAGSDAKVPKLNRLNSPEWKKTKTRVKGAVKEIAGELVELYAKRQAKKGHCFEKDTVWQKEFEELFPYEETEDQLKAIEVTKADMESSRIMDRLICGDVGYGKTEIAIRAAFKAVMDGCQVAFLVPTTILAAQHYNTFSQRMRDYGINVELLCRLRTPSEQKKTIEGLKKGSVDIVIGTHRLLSKSVSYKNLGLLMIDEEQRFGVTHKEKLKQMKNDIDVLTLTATPIPRTCLLYTSPSPRDA